MGTSQGDRRPAGWPELTIVLGLTLQLCLVLPAQVALRNPGELATGLWSLVPAYVALLLAATAVLYLIGTRLARRLFLPVVFFLSAAVFLESRLFLALARHAPFDGSPIDWQPFRTLGLVELTALTALGLLVAWGRRRVARLSSISLFIILFSCLALAHGLLTRPLLPPTSADDPDRTLYLDQFARLSPERNVIHIVADQAQGAMLYDVLNDSGRSGAFDGFVLFVGASGRYQSTYPNLPYYMAGEAPEPQFDIVGSQPYTWEYVQQTLERHSIVTALAEAGFRTFGFQFHPGLLCTAAYTACTGSHDEVFAGVPVGGSGSALRDVLTGLDVALFQAAPLALRPLIHSDGRWLLRRRVQRRSHAGPLEAFADRMEMGAPAPTYNYLHLGAAHAPFLFDRECRYIGPQEISAANQREQLECTVQWLARLVDGLKALGVYDETLIVIHGDHGTPWVSATVGARWGDVIPERVMGWANAAVLVKPLGRRGPLEVSDGEVTIGDVPATILDSLDLAGAVAGVSVLGDVAPARERSFFTYDDDSRVFQLQALPRMRRYRIVGNIFDERSWVLPRSRQQPGSGLRMDQEGFSTQARGFSHLERAAEPYRWVDGQKAVVSLESPEGTDRRLVLETHLPSVIVDQTMRVTANGRLLGVLGERELRKRHHELPLPDGLGDPEGELIIEFDLSTTFSAPGDRRKLSIVFYYVGVEGGV